MCASVSLIIDQFPLAGVQSALRPDNQFPLSLITCLSSKALYVRLIVLSEVKDRVLHPLPIVLASLCYLAKPSPTDRIDRANIVSDEDIHKIRSLEKLDNHRSPPLRTEVRRRKTA